MSEAIYETLEEAVDPRHTALLVIDVQNDLCQEDCRAMVPRLEQLISAARKAGVYVVYIQNTTYPQGMSNSASETARRKRLGMRSEVTVNGTWGEKFVDQIAPQPNDPVVRKHRMSSFVGTDLDMLLRCRGIQSVVCTGVATHGCVMNTAYSAVGYDYYVAVVEDCVAAGRRDLHDGALFLLKNGVHYVVGSAALIEAWQRPSSSLQEARLA
jgi:nicotinamidase-related amidase